MGRWRVRVCLENYGRTGVVVVTRRRFSRFYHNGLRVATVCLSADDAEEQLAEARAKARSLIGSINTLEGEKF